MYVCVCKAVSDSRIKRLVKEGATTLRDVSRETALGTCCGKCVPAAREVLSEALAAQPIRLADLVMSPAMSAAA
jgi:bacterioferritin-associated ferredoxin